MHQSFTTNTAKYSTAQNYQPALLSKVQTKHTKADYVASMQAKAALAASATLEIGRFRLRTAV
jgi:hypothetical protein